MSIVNPHNTGTGTNMVTRRRLIRALCALPLAACLPGMGRTQNSPEAAQLKAGYAQRLKKLLAAGRLPYIDIESSCDPSRVDIDAVAQSLEELGIGLMALSADIGRGRFREGVRFDNLSERLVASHPHKFIPVGNGGQPPALT